MSMTAAKPTRKPQSRGKRFCFTLNNWTETEYSYLTGPVFTACTRWMVVAKESGENGTPHLQGAFILHSQTAFSTVRKHIGLTRAHLEPMIGSPQDSLVYCSKQDAAPFVFGSPPTPGKRNDLASATKKILNGDSIASLCTETEDAVCVVKYHKGLTVLRSLVRPKRTEPPKIYWMHGKTGTGKTRSSFESANRLGDVWISSGGLRWFDGYDGQRSAIFDDFRSKGVVFPFLLRLLDRYPMSVEIKGAHVEWTPEFIFITCPEEPHDTFKTRSSYIPEDVNQLIRRIEQGGGGIFEMPDDGDKFRENIERFLPVLPGADPVEVPLEADEPPEEGEPEGGEMVEDDDLSFESYWMNRFGGPPPDDEDVYGEDN